MSGLAAIPYAGARPAVPGMKPGYRAVSPHFGHSPCIPGGNLAVRDPHSPSAHGSGETAGGSRACGQLRVNARSWPAAAAGPAGSGTWPVRSGLVPPLAEGFIARTETVPGLEAALVPGAAVALVTGSETAGGARDWPGSCGKTQLAAYLAGSLWRSRAVDLLAWVAATSRASVLAGYGQAAAKLGLDHGGDAEAVAARFLAWLDGTSRPWLVVLDDLRDAADLDGLMPAGPAGRVLVTAADAAAMPGEHRVRVLAVPGFSTREALNYLSGRLTTDPDQRSGAIDLAGELGGEPAALAQAAAVIVSSGIRCREYRDYFAQRRAQLAAAGAARCPRRRSPGRCRPSTPGSWHRTGEPGRSLRWPRCWTARRFPGPCSPRLPPASTSTARASPAADPGAAWSAVLALERAGLLAIDAAGTPPAVWVSPALQAAVRAAAPPDLLDRAARAAADALAEVWPAGQPRSWLAAALRSCAASLRQAAGDALWDAGGCHRLLLAAGHSLDAAGLTGPAVTWWRELAAGSHRLLGPGHPDTVLAGGLLAGALLAAGQAAEAVTWFGWVAGRTRRRARARSPRHHRGPRSASAARWSPPASPARRSPCWTRRPATASGSTDPTTPEPWPPGTSMPPHAWPRARPARRSRCYQRSLAGRERLHGPDHPGTLDARLRLAGACLAAGKTRDAIAQHKTVLAGREHALGADHPDTLAARARLAAAYDAAGQMGDALQLHQETCAGYERVFGGDHPDTLARRADLAHAYSAAGQLGEAVTLLRDTITRSEQALSPGDPLTRALRQALAGITGGDDRPVTASQHPHGRNTRDGVRLHHRRGRHGRLRAGRPAQRGSRHPGAAAGSGQRRRGPAP